MAEATKTIHGIDFVRSGKCNQCGECGCNRCPHGELKGGKWECAIYDTRGDVCKSCSDVKGKDVTHQVCIDFPDHPFLWVLHKGVCGYTFEPKTQADIDKVDDLEIRYAD